MGVQVSRSVIVKDKEGHEIVLAPNEAVITSTDAVIICDSSKCESRHGTRYSYSWNEEEAQKNPALLSDQFFHLIKVTIDPVTPKELVFCSQQCTRDWLTYEFVPAKSPRELAAEQVVQKTDGLPTADDLDAVARDAHYAAIVGTSPDATGFSGE